MKRAAVATGITIVLLAGFAPAASARERQVTRTAPYRGHSPELECPSRLFDTDLLEQPNRLACGTANTAHATAFSGRTRFAAPAWARSVRLSIRDDSGRPVGFVVYFNNDTGNSYQFTSSTCTQAATLNLKRATKRITVARPLAYCYPHTTGVVTATFSSRRATNPSPRHYMAGCALIGTVAGPGVGPSCSYTASKPGGYFGAGVWRIQIVRGNETIDVEPVNGDPHCSRAGFIHAGDLVTLNILVGYVSAADNVSCEHPVPAPSPA